MSRIFLKGCKRLGLSGTIESKAQRFENELNRLATIGTTKSFQRQLDAAIRNPTVRTRVIRIPDYRDDFDDDSESQIARPPSKGRIRPVSRPRAKLRLFPEDVQVAQITADVLASKTRIAFWLEELIGTLARWSTSGRTSRPIRAANDLLHALQEMVTADLKDHERGFFLVQQIVAVLDAKSPEQVQALRSDLESCPSAVRSIQAACGDMLSQQVADESAADDKLVTVNVDAQVTGMKKANLSKLCSAGTIICTGIGSKRRVNLKSAQAYAKNRQKRSR